MRLFENYWTSKKKIVILKINMNDSGRKGIFIKLDKRRIRDIKIIFTEGLNQVHEFTLNREYLSAIPNFLWLLFSMEIFGGNPRGVKVLNRSIEDKLGLTDIDED